MKWWRISTSFSGAISALASGRSDKFATILPLRLNVVIESPGNVDLADQPDDPRMAIVRKRFFRANRFPDRISAPLAELVPAPGLDDDVEARTLRQAQSRFQASEGPFVPHPFLGSLTKDEWTRFHRIHAAHHLGFVVPVRIG